MLARRAMGSTTSFRDLEVWQLSMQLVEDVYKVTRLMPREEFDLRRQIRRAAVSIPVNVAEGWRRRSRLAYRNHVSIALGSQAELETEFEIAARINALPVDVYADVLSRAGSVGRMLTRLHQRLSEEVVGRG
ncbi:MAG: four helix bundle protein [Vicinamibacterales bacterium]|nr:four helix bundle protein [Vicinamibacterales bacterium]